MNWKGYIFARITIALVSIIVYSNKWSVNGQGDANFPGTADIAAFNIRIFGQAKASQPVVMNSLIKILLRYDLILIQEIRDSSGASIVTLLDQLNKNSSSTYGMVVSARLGRTSSKEQYAYIFRTDIFTVTDKYVYNDANDVFEREPFVVRFSSASLAVQDFACIGIHTKPSDAQSEISHLVDVYNDAVGKWTNLQDFIIMGDFNAGCNYVQDWKQIKLATDHSFYWLINDKVDTTAGDTQCPYDRIVIKGDKLVNAVITMSPGTFRFDKEYGLGKDEALDISDHYPVHMQIKSKNELSNIKYSRSFTIRDETNKGFSKSNLRKLRNAAIGNSLYTVRSVYTKTGSYSEFEISRVVIGEKAVHQALNKMKLDFSNFITDTQIEVAKRDTKELNIIKDIPHGNGYYYTLYDIYKYYQPEYKLEIYCMYYSAQECWSVVGVIGFVNPVSAG